MAAEEPSDNVSVGLETPLLIKFFKKYKAVVLLALTAIYFTALGLLELLFEKS